MKKSLIISLLLCAATFTAEAQSWLDAVKKIAAETVDNATGGKLTALAIVGTWNYEAPAVRTSSDDVASNIGGTLASSALNSKIAAAFEKVGISKGFCSITIDKDGTFSMPVKSKTLNGTYEFDPSTHSITLVFGKSAAGTFTGYAYISGTNLQLVFPVDKFVGFLTSVGSKVSALSSVTAMLQQCENAHVGLEFSK